MKRLMVRLATVVVGLAVFAVAGLSGATASTAASTAGTSTVAAPVTGAAADGSSFAGTFTPTHFANQNGSLIATGDLVGTMTRPTGATQSVSRTAALPVNTAASTGSCEVLNLVLGPLDLNLLGLTVHLDTVHLNITAVPGAGNLLGNLLCAVAGLLDGTGVLNGLLTQLAGLLNQILGALGAATV